MNGPERLIHPTAPRLRGRERPRGRRPCRAVYIFPLYHYERVFVCMAPYKASLPLRHTLQLYCGVVLWPRAAPYRSVQLHLQLYDIQL